MLSDLDGTLRPDAGVNTQVAMELLRRGWVIRSKVMTAFLTAVTQKRNFKMGLHAAAAKSFEGRTTEEIDDLYTHAVAAAHDRGQLWFPGATGFIRSLIEQQIHLLIISGSPEPQIRRSLQSLQLHDDEAQNIRIAGSIYETERGIYTGRVLNTMETAKEKETAVTQTIGDDNRIVGALGNSEADLPLLLSVPHQELRVLVGHDPRVIRALRRKGYDIKNGYLDPVVPGGLPQILRIDGDFQALMQSTGLPSHRT